MNIVTLVVCQNFPIALGLDSEIHIYPSCHISRLRMSNDLLFDAFKADTAFEDIPIMWVLHRHA
jgi:hypothetical protein